MKTGRLLRAVGYVRVSDESQVERHSLDAQRNEIASWCERQNHVLTGIYSDEGVSAYTDRIERRPRLVELLRDADIGKFDLVVVHTLDRWARNVGAQREALRRLGDAGVGFASVTENIDFSTPGGRLLLTTMGGVSEFFSDQLGVHVSKAQRHRAGLGLPVGPVPFGYVTKEPGGVPQADEREADAVRDVFQRKADGESNAAIATWLNERGLRTRKGGMFTGHAVKDLLNARFYVGKIQYRGEEHEAKHAPLISEELYLRAQARRQVRRVIRTVRGPKGLLQGMLSCGNCGSSIQSDRHRFGAPMYRERHSRKCHTNGRSVVARAVDEQIATILRSVELEPRWRERMAYLATAQCDGPNLNELQRRRKRVCRAYADGAFTDDEYAERLAEIDAVIRRTTVVALPTLKDAAELFENIPELWEEATPEERRTLVSPLLERVYVDLETKRIGAITPVPAFRALLEGAAAAAESSEVRLISVDEAEQMQVWSWWRRGRVELPVQKTL